MTMLEQCNHAKPFSVRCIDCEFVSAREGLRWAQENVKLYSNLIAKLEAEQALRATLSSGHGEP